MRSRGCAAAERRGRAWIRSSRSLSRCCPHRARGSPQPSRKSASRPMPDRTAGLVTCSRPCSKRARSPSTSVPVPRNWPAPEPTRRSPRRAPRASSPCRGTTRGFRRSSAASPTRRLFSGCGVTSRLSPVPPWRSSGPGRRRRTPSMSPTGWGRNCRIAGWSSRAGWRGAWTLPLTAAVSGVSRRPSPCSARGSTASIRRSIRRWPERYPIKGCWSAS